MPSSTITYSHATAVLATLHQDIASGAQCNFLPALCNLTSGNKQRGQHAHPTDTGTIADGVASARRGAGRCARCRRPGLLSCPPTFFSRSSAADLACWPRFVACRCCLPKRPIAYPSLTSHAHVHTPPLLVHQTERRPLLRHSHSRLFHLARTAVNSPTRQHPRYP